MIDRVYVDRRKGLRREIDHIVCRIVSGSHTGCISAVTNIIKLARILPDTMPFTQREGETCRRYRSRRSYDGRDIMTGMSHLKQQIFYKVNTQYDQQYDN